MKSVQTSGLLCTLLLCSGCGVAAFAEPKTNPVIEDRIGSVAATLATTAERRIVLFPTVGGNEGKFCAEPSPDTAESIAATFKASLEASGKATDKGEGKVNAEIAKALLTSVAALTKRSQGLQLYRDGVYALCQSRMNDFVSADEYIIALRVLRETAAKLISEELKTESWSKPIQITIGAPAAVDVFGKTESNGEGDKKENPEQTKKDE